MNARAVLGILATLALLVASELRAEPISEKLLQGNWKVTCAANAKFLRGQDAVTRQALTQTVALMNAVPITTTYGGDGEVEITITSPQFGPKAPAKHVRTGTWKVVSVDKDEETVTIEQLIALNAPISIEGNVIKVDEGEAKDGEPQTHTYTFKYNNRNRWEMGPPDEVSAPMQYFLIRKRR